MTVTAELRRIRTLIDTAVVEDHDCNAAAMLLDPLLGQTQQVLADAADEIDALTALVTRLSEIPSEHRDEFMASKDPINWLHQAAPGMPLRIEIDTVRDTCDALIHKLRDAVANAAGTPPVPPGGAEVIAAERRRQIAEESWTPEHDDEHDNGEMTEAAATYLSAAQFVVRSGRDDGDRYFRGHPPRSDTFRWPWRLEWWKPVWSDPKRMLVKAGALIAAEIDRLERKERS